MAVVSTRTAAMHAGAGLLTCTVLWLSACAGGKAVGMGAVAFTADERNHAFEVTRETLRDLGYKLDRVDAERGVITTQVRPSGGLPNTTTPVQDVLHEQDRTVRVEFGTGGDGSKGAQVMCFVRRVHTPGTRLSTRAIGLSETAYDPLDAERGVAWRFASPLTRDEAAASRIAIEIEKRLRAGK